jgi:transposase InsO family protein
MSDTPARCSSCQTPWPTTLPWGGLKQRFTRAYRPQTNGKAEHFIQSALREWAYGIPYNHSQERADMLERWNHHYNWHRPHQGIGGVAPIRCLSKSRSNLLMLHIDPSRIAS